MFDDLTDKNIDLYTAKVYDNPQCLSTEEFNDDMKRVKYIKRLLNRYGSTGELKERLVLNHLIILYNVFGIVPASRILFFRINEEFWPTLKTFLTYLNCMPDKVEGIAGRTIINSDIELDATVIDRLREV